MNKSVIDVLVNNIKNLVLANPNAKFNIVWYGVEPTLNSKFLEEALSRLSKLKNIKQIELVTNGLLPQNISEKTFSLIDKISISVYTDHMNFITAWKNYVQRKSSRVNLYFRNQKKWDLNSGNKIVSKEISQKMFENCWYKNHCVTIERGKLFLCSIAAKHLSDIDGLPLHEKITKDEIISFILRKNQLNYCCRCIPEMKLGKVDGGQQCGNANLSRLIDEAIKYMNS